MNNTENSLPATTEADKDMIDVIDMSTLVKLLARWHANTATRCEHLLELPDGQVVQIDNDPELVITGDVRKGFLLGVNMALMEFGTLPFSFELEDAPLEPVVK